MKNLEKKILFRVLVFIAILCGIIVTGCEKEVSISPVEPPPPEGFIYVSSNPSGFAIFQNGRNTGRKTPDSLTYLEPGIYEITLSKNYYKDTSVTITVSEDEKSVVDVDYLSNPTMFGNLALFSQPPGATIVFEDSVFNRVTPDTLLHLLPGAYNVRLSMFDHRDAEFDAVVRSGETSIYFEELRDTSEWIDFQVFNSSIQSNTLSAITVDENNVKWIGSLDKGLIRYDESMFINYNTTNSSIPSNRVQSLTVAPNNDIWVGTNFGLGIFNGTSWTVYTQLNSDIPTDIVNGVDFDDMGIAWISTSGGVARFDGFNWNVFNDSQLRIWAMDLSIDINQEIWIGTREHGIVSLVDSALIYYPDSIYNYATERISSTDIDQMGNVWFCHMPDSARSSGVSFWDGNVFTNFFLGTVNNNVNNIFIDDQDNKWISTHEGFIKFDQQNVSTIFTTFNSLISSHQTNASVRDINGAVWITTQGGGLNKYKEP